jgi:hypothetical protein
VERDLAIEATKSDVHQDVSEAKVRQHVRNRLHSHAKLAVPHLLVLLAGLAHLIATLVAFSIGLYDISGPLQSQLKVARLEAGAQCSMKYREEVLYVRLDEFRDTRLNNKYKETYEDCLARGLKLADQHLFGLGFQYADIRNQTIDWTVENCGRLHYTPQPSQPSVQQAALTHWAKTTYRARCIAEKTLTLITHHAKLFRAWLSKHGVRSLKEPEPTLSGSRVSGGVASPRRTQMPFGFALQCDELSACRLVYAPSSGTPIDKVTVSNESIAKSMLKVKDLLTVYTSISVVQNFITRILPWLIVQELFWLSAWFLYTCYPQAVHFFSTRYSAYFSATKVNEAPQARRFTQEEQYLALYVVVQLLTMAIHAVVVLVSGPESQATLVFGILLVTHGMILLSNYIVSAREIFSIFTLYKTIKSLCLVSYRVWTDPEIWTDDFIGSRIVRRPAAPEKCLLPISPVSGPRFAPTVSLQGASLGYELDSVEGDQGGDASDDSCSQQGLIQEDFGHCVSDDSGTQSSSGNEDHSRYTSDCSDGEPESDAEGYVDLAGGITPTTTEDSDWSIVEA